MSTKGHIVPALLDGLISFIVLVNIHLLFTGKAFTFAEDNNIGCLEMEF